MTQELSPDENRDIDLLLASLRADMADTHAFLQALAVRLDGALPGQVEVERHGGLFSRDHSVKRIALDLGERRYGIADEGHGRLRAERTNVVRNIALKTEQLGVDEWLQSLAGDLAGMAQRSGRGREALERLLLGRPPEA
ncbi:MAG TPA: hypothetical protein VKV26_08615 [Dehalococcoidia bacterium]|nr:hypothetical protein [Dehalococcoidia bacterium]